MIRKILTALGLLAIGAGVALEVVHLRSSQPIAASDNARLVQDVREGAAKVDEKALDQSAVVTNPSGRHSVTLFGSSTGVPQTTKPRRSYKDLPFNPDKAEAWRAKYSNMTVLELENARTKIEDSITAAADPILNSMLDDGSGTMVSGDTSTYKISKDDAQDICAIRAKPGTGVYRAVLPRDEYPDLYNLKEETLWLGYEITGRVRAAASGKPHED